MARYVVLLRGVNLGPTRRVPIAELREALAEGGHEDVRTLLASGNVVLTSDLDPDALRADVEARLRERFGIEVPVVVRTRDELAAVVAHNPLGAIADDPKRHQVSFLSAELDDAVACALLERDVAPEVVAIAGREIHAWHPGGLQRSRLAGLLDDRKLGVTVTARNWNTVTALLTLADEAG